MHAHTRTHTHTCIHPCPTYTHTIHTHTHTHTHTHQLREVGRKYRSLSEEQKKELEGLRTERDELKKKVEEAPPISETTPTTSEMAERNQVGGAINWSPANESFESFVGIEQGKGRGGEEGGREGGRVLQLLLVCSAHYIKECNINTKLSPSLLLRSLRRLVRQSRLSAVLCRRRTNGTRSWSRR